MSDRALLLNAVRSFCLAAALACAGVALAGLNLVADALAEILSAPSWSFFLVSGLIVATGLRLTAARRS